ncbi:hypothetical protein NGRA_1946 [Nosema granulosis]|uniref:Uncharacterized protein n=1 Tax=Nosema granulosis TaxID=83296 RepID=A0A9P6KY57_9MICR|nr:hypothetical protein NGRA_1946 [Nosema granulosis]
MQLLFIYFCTIFVLSKHVHKTSSHRVVHLRVPHKVSQSHIDVHANQNYKDRHKNPLIRELEEAEKIDQQTLEELKKPITDEMLHNPNVPIYEPYKLTEAQQVVLLSHE